MGVFQKVCCGCSADVAEQVRVKDQEGRYFCQPCFETKTRSKMPEAAIAASRPSPPPMARKAPQQAPAPTVVDDTYDIAFVEPVKPAPPPLKTKEEVFGCADCKKLVTQRQIRNDDGDFVCIPCFTRRRKNAPATGQINAPVRRKSFAEEDGVSDALPFHYTILGGFLISLGILFCSWCIFFGVTLGFHHAARGGVPVTIIVAGVMATFEMIFVLFRAFAIMVGLYFVAKIFGGCDLGSFGYSLWRAVASGFALALISYFMELDISFALIGIPIRIFVAVVIYMGVFKLDKVEASLLSVFNFVIFWVLNIGMLIMLAAALAAISH